mgnify:CR=1 FL=1
MSNSIKLLSLSLLFNKEVDINPFTFKHSRLHEVIRLILVFRAKILEVTVVWVKYYFNFLLYFGTIVMHAELDI